MISHDTVQRIGRFIDMPYTNFNGRINIPENVDEITSILSGECIYYKKDGKKLLIFNEICSKKRVYIINLYTFTPTSKSYIQKELTPYLRNRLMIEMYHS